MPTEDGFVDLADRQDRPGLGLVPPLVVLAVGHEQVVERNAGSRVLDDAPSDDAEVFESEE